MKSFILPAIAAFSYFTIFFSIAMNAQSDCRSVLQRYMDEYPASDLCDVYKFCFQDIFGPAHLTLDSASAIMYIRSELEKSKTLGGPDYQYAGCEGNYVRVNLALVKNGKLSADQLADCLRRSIAQPHPMSVEEWKAKWNMLENILADMKPQPGHFALDSESIRSLLNRGGYTVHHSFSFNTAYNFHYRIIRRDIFENEIFPLISNKKKKH